MKLKTLIFHNIVWIFLTVYISSKYILFFKHTSLKSRVCYYRKKSIYILFFFVFLNEEIDMDLEY